MNPAFPWRVVTLDDEGAVKDCFGYMHDEAAARRVQETFADRGELIVQYQPPPTAYPWTIVDPVVVVPDDGKEHRCACGRGGYRAWDGDGWLRHGNVVTDDEGRTVTSCHSCDRELEAGA